MLIHKTGLEDVPELLHCIQSLLPVKEAARTCILSKSWFHVWATIPTLRFTLQDKNLIDCTLTRYLKGNIPIESFYLVIGYNNGSMAEKWIQPVVSKSCLKKLSLIIYLEGHTMLKFPDEIFSGENLNEIHLMVYGVNLNNSFSISSNVEIKCVSLRVLDISRVKVSDEVINNLLSTSKLLEMVTFSYLKDVKIFKVKNLCYLRELTIASEENSYTEIGNVPNLHSISYQNGEKLLTFCNDSLPSVKHLTLVSIIMNAAFFDTIKSKFPHLETFNILTCHQLAENLEKWPTFLASVKHLTLGGGIIMNAAFFDMIKSKFPYLESLNISTCRQPATESLDVRSLTLKSLTLKFSGIEPTCIQVNAPNLLIFGYDGWTIPNLSFRANAHGKIVFKWVLRNPEDRSLYLKMRETLNVSTKFDIEMDEFYCPDFVKVDIDYIRRNVPFPATNVEKLLFGMYWDGHSRLLDVLFSICHPNYLAYQDKLLLKSSEILNSCKLLLRDMMEMKLCGLKSIEIKNPCNGKWEALNSCCVSSLDTSSVDWNFLEFKLNWSSEYDL